MPQQTNLERTKAPRNQSSLPPTPMSLVLPSLKFQKNRKT